MDTSSVAYWARYRYEEWYWDRITGQKSLRIINAKLFVKIEPPKPPEKSELCWEPTPWEQEIAREIAMLPRWSAVFASLLLLIGLG